ncbi:MAG: hypothetical protein LBU64_00870 [Planctomycetota bacterium]|jgi:hypothetical protein|nr:hypothetical protein [Planctomycetota bacterium]
MAANTVDGTITDAGMAKGSPGKPADSLLASRGILAIAGIPDRDGMFESLAAYLTATAKAADEGGAKARADALKAIQDRYWRFFIAILSAAARRGTALEFSDEERLFLDLGLVDVRMLGGGYAQAVHELVAKLNRKGSPGCYYLTEWLAELHRQMQLESTLSRREPATETNSSAKITEMRVRVLNRLAPLLTGLPGIPLEVSEAMRLGNLDREVISSGLAALRDPRRQTFWRRRSLWLLRAQLLEKVRARAGDQNNLRLLELLDEIYVRDWRERYENFIQEIPAWRSSRIESQSQPSPAEPEAEAANPRLDALVDEGRQLRLRLALMDAINGKEGPDPALTSGSGLLAKEDLAKFLLVAQTFDRTLTEIPPLIIMPGSGRGFFSWENGCLLICLRPLVSPEDSAATALAWYRMLHDRFNNNGMLRTAYGKKFPGAVFHTEFPADYRAWLCHAVKGDLSAMNPQRRVFFRDFIGPDISGPMLPANLRNIGPQTLATIARRLEKQIAGGDKDVKLYRRLAAIYWQQGNNQAAGMQYTAAMGLAPNDGETIFAAGMFLRSNGDIEAANECFRIGREQASGSLWGIYCRDALDNLL